VRSDLSDASINVEVSNGVARLTGEVQGQLDHLAALTIAEATEGVRSVIDDLQVKPLPKVSAEE